MSAAAYAPLLGHNLVRLVYLDEAGTDFKATHLCVAGVVVHGDQQWPEIDRRIRALIDKYVPDDQRGEFIFHAKDIFHGSNFFDRRKPEWDSPEKRIPVLNELAEIIKDLHLSVVAGHYKKDGFGAGVLTNRESQKSKGMMIHGSALSDCLVWADQWLAEFSPTELATVVHEDGPDAKPIIKRAVRILRHPDLLKKSGIPPDQQSEMALPLKRIIDTVHFADKRDARPLQLADLCAFVLGRGIKDMTVPVLASDIILRHLKWRDGLTPKRPSLKLSSEAS